MLYLIIKRKDTVFNIKDFFQTWTETTTIEYTIKFFLLVISAVVDVVRLYFGYSGNLRERVTNIEQFVIKQ